MTERKSKHHLLISLLMPLLREWGYDTVRKCLDEAKADRAKENISLEEHKRKVAKEYRRPTAVELVERVEVGEDRKKFLCVLASRFDSKTFLPTAPDVRHFLEMRGQNPELIKHRQDSFRKVLDVLLSMSDDELIPLQASGAHMGPTQLGPLSDAIKATSAAVRSAALDAEPSVSEEAPEPKGKGSDGR